MNLVSRYLTPQLVERLNTLQLTARRVVEGSTAGQHRAHFKGASVEFRQHRFYVPGDEPRRLDWRVLARTDRLHIKEYDEETNLRCLILLDASGSMAYGSPTSKFEYACGLTIALAYLMLASTEQVGLALCRSSLDRWMPPRSGTAQLSRFAATLDAAQPSGAGDLSRCLATAADRLGRRGLIILISDFLAPLEKIQPGLARLSHDRHELLALRVLDRDEIDFPFRHWTLLSGLEHESPRLCDPAVMRQAYLEQFERHAQLLRRRCRALRADFDLLPTDEPLAEAITQLVARRS